MGAVAQVMQPVATEQRVIGDVHIDAVTGEADVVGYDPRAAAVIELDAIAALCRSQITHTGDVVTDDLNVFHLLDPQAKQGVVDGVIANDGAVTARLEVNAGILCR